jgi:ribosomal protein L40E
MGKVGKTFTCDVKVLIWLEEYAKKQQKKESAIVNALLNSAKRQEESWICPECQASNANAFSDCHNCDYVVSVKA